MNSKELYIKLLEYKMSLAMKDVHKQVKIYEDRLKSNTLSEPTIFYQTLECTPKT